MKPSIEIIVAVDRNGGFGLGGEIPWKCKEDMKQFATVSKECGVCVMGRSTYQDMLDMRGELTDELKESIKTKGILPGRTCFVVSSTLKADEVIGAEVVDGLRAVVNKYHNTEQRIAVIGGEKMYTQAIASASVVHMSIIDNVYKCDRFFPVDFLKHFHTPTEPTLLDAEVDGVASKLLIMKYQRR